MTTATREKRCKVCGVDVSQAKRTKDATGSYYCEPCVQGMRSRSEANQPAPTVTPARTCANCNRDLGALEQGAEWQGHRVCLSCARSLAAEEDAKKPLQAEHANPSPTPMAPAAPAVEPTEAKPPQKRSEGLIVFGVLFFVASLVCCSILIGLLTDGSADARQSLDGGGFLLLLVYTAIFNVAAMVLYYLADPVSRERLANRLPEQLGELVIAIGKPRTLHGRALALGTITGKTYAEIVAGLGQSRSMSSVSSQVLRQWNDRTLHLTLIFDGDTSDSKCVKIMTQIVH